MMRLLSRLAGGVDAQLAALQAAIPTAAQAMPPGVGVGGAKGSQTTAYALADHTHATSNQRNSIAVTMSAGTGAGQLTFLKPYAAGVIPTVQLTPETPSDASYFYTAEILAGSITNTGCVVVVNKISKSVTLPAVALSLLNFVVNIFAPATGSVTVHYSAGIPTGIN